VALDRLDDDPLPDESLDWTGIDEDVAPRVQEVLTHVDRCCDDLLNVEYGTACRRLTLASRATHHLGVQGSASSRAETFLRAAGFSRYDLDCHLDATYLVSTRRRDIIDERDRIPSACANRMPAVPLCQRLGHPKRHLAQMITTQHPPRVG
jgi:hypothetical protein